MTDKKDDIEVTVSEDPDLALPLDFELVEVKKDDKDASVVAKAADKSAAEDDPIASLQRQLDEAKAEADRERRARADAERQANDYAQRATAATTGTIAAQLDSVENALANTKSRATAAEKAYASALEVADYDAAAKHQREMSGAEYDLRALETGKRELLQRQKRAAEAPKTERQPAAGVDAFVDQIIESSSAAAADYVKRNRSALTSEKAVNRMIAAHNLAVNSDVTVDSKDYFDFIDKQMGWGEPARQEPRPAPKADTKSVAAPVSRDGAPGNTNASRVTLTPAQVAIAKELGITPSAYAKNLMKLKANGRDPNADGLRLSADIRH
jgi:hypothetical protein